MPINADIQQQVFDLLSRASNLSFVGADQESGDRIGLTPGQKVVAEVLLTLPDGRVQVGIGGERFNLELPLAVRLGQTVEMTFVSSEPRSTFAIARPASAAPMVSLSDASRLLALLADGVQVSDPGLRASLKSVGEILQRSPGDAGVLASLMDEALTYGGKAEGGQPGFPSASPAPARSGTFDVTPLQMRSTAAIETPLTGFESGASRILHQIARSSRSIIVEAVNPPLMPLSLTPGDEVDALVLGTFPGGRVFVRVAGAELELLLPRPVQESEILRLTVVASQPKPLFAIPRAAPETGHAALSDAGRWLSVLEQSGGGFSAQQRYVLDRLTTILKNLPPDSPAFTAILDEPITYRQAAGVTRTAEQNPGPAVGAGAPPIPLQGSGIVFSDDMAKLLQALIKGNRLTLLEALNQLSQPQRFEPGQQMKGEVLASLGDGRFLVQVAEQAFEFTLPKGTRPGDRLTLFYITDEPRISFLMARFGRPGDARVSEAGRWLSGFLGTAPERMPVNETLGILRTLLLGPPSDAARVGTLLQQGLRESGLFYESHLARWFEGDYRLEDLLREPQGRLSRLGQPDAEFLAGGGPPEERIAAAMNGRQPARVEIAFGKTGGEGGHEFAVDRASLAVVREQLEALQSGQVVFRGELFAGQKMEWAVGEREAGRNASGGRERGWDSVLRVDLPRLGSISARLKLDGMRISIDLSTGNPDSAVSLESGKQSLVEQLQAAGLEPAGIGIRHAGP